MKPFATSYVELISFSKLLVSTSKESALDSIYKMKWLTMLVTVGMVNFCCRMVGLNPVESLTDLAMI